MWIILKREGMKRVISAVLLLLFFRLLPASGTEPEYPKFDLYTSSKAYVEDQIIVGFKQDISREDILSFIEEHNLRLTKPLDDFHIYTLFLPPDLNVRAAKRRLSKDNRVDYVLPNYYTEPQSSSSSTGIDLDRIRELNEDVLEQIGWGRALEFLANLPKGDPTIVAIIDSGLCPYMEEELRREGVFVGGHLIKEDDSGQTIILPYDQYPARSDREYIELAKHGTAVTSVVAMSKDFNDIAIIEDGKITLDTIILGIRHAADSYSEDNRGLVINLSLGIKGSIYIVEPLTEYYLGQWVEGERERGRSDIDIYNGTDGRSYNEMFPEFYKQAEERVDEVLDIMPGLGIINILELSSEDCDLLGLSPEERSAWQEALLEYRAEQAALEEVFSFFSESAVIVSGAGNEPGNLDLLSTTKSTIGVGGIKPDGELSQVSSLVYDLAAPNSFYVHYPLGASNSTSAIRKATGTSISAPLVSMVAGLVWNYFPNLSAQEIRNIILRSALENSSGIKTLNAEIAVKTAYHYSELKTDPELILTRRNMLSDEAFCLASALVINHLADKELAKNFLINQYPDIASDIIGYSIELQSKHEDRLDLFSLQNILSLYRGEDISHRPVEATLSNALRIDTVDDSNRLRILLQESFPLLDSAIISSVIHETYREENCSTYLTARITGGLIEIFNHMDNFDLPDNTAKPPEPITVDEIVTWADWTQWLDQLVLLADEDSSNIKKLHFDIMEIIDDSIAISNDLLEKVDELIWYFLYDYISVDFAKMMLLNLIAEEADLDTKTALDIVRTTDHYGYIYETLPIATFADVVSQACSVDDYKYDIKIMEPYPATLIDWE
jgi:hypothetical protein